MGTTVGTPPAIISPSTTSTHISLQLRRFSGSPKDNPEAFLRSLKYAKGASGWSDVQALYYTGLHLDGKAAEWFSNSDFTRWDPFEKAFLERFGLDPSKMLGALSRRTQGDKESVRDYADSLRTLARCSSNPHVGAMLLHFFIEGLQDRVRDFVLSRRPRTFEDAVAEGEYYEDQFVNRKNKVISFNLDMDETNEPSAKSAPFTPRAAVEQRRKPPDAIAEITKGLSELRLQMAQLQRATRPNNAAAPPKNGCFNCGDPGHQARECPHPRRRTGPMNGINYMEEALDAAPEAYYYGQEVYAQEKRAREEAEERRAPAPRRFRPAPFDPENLPDAPPLGMAPGKSLPTYSQRAPVRNPPPMTAQPPSGDRAPTARAPATRPTSRSTPVTSTTPLPGYNVVTQLDATPARVSVSELLRHSPVFRAQIKQFLEKLEADGAVKPRRVAGENAPPVGKVNLYQSTGDALEGGYPSKSTRTLGNASCHATINSEEMAPPPAPVARPTHGTPSVVRINCKVFGMPVVAIVDSGASHSVIAESIVRKLQLHHDLEPTNSTFLTAGGQKEKPWGVLREVPVTVGKLTLNLDVPVTGAKTYQLLLGNDWLVQAACHMFWDARKMRFMVNPYEFDEIDFDVEGQLRAPSVFHLHPRAETRAGHPVAVCMLEMDASTPPLSHAPPPAPPLPGTPSDPFAEELSHLDHAPESSPNLAEGNPWNPTPDGDSSPAPGLDDEPCTSDAPIMATSPPSATKAPIAHTELELPDARDKRPASRAPSPAEARVKRHPPLFKDSSDLRTSPTNKPPDSPRPLITKEDYLWARTHTAPAVVRRPPPFPTDPSHSAAYTYEVTDEAGPIPNPDRFVDLCDLDRALRGSMPPIVTGNTHDRLQPQHYEPSHFDPRFLWGSEGYSNFSYSWPYHYDSNGNPVGHETTPPPLDSVDSPLPPLIEDDDNNDDDDTDGIPRPPIVRRAPLRSHPDLEALGAHDFALFALHEELAEEVPHELPPTEVERAASLQYGEQLIPAERNLFEGLIFDNLDVFAFTRDQLTATHLGTHKIPTGDAAPIAQRPYRLSFHEQQVEREEVEKLLKLGLIEPNYGPWCSPTILIPKKDGGYRLVVDYRKLNSVTVKDETLLPRIDETLDKIGKSRVFSKLDLLSGFWQIPLDPDDQPKSTFCTRSGNYNFKVMPMGLCSAPATFQRLMRRVFTESGMSDYVMVYLDDIIVHSKTVAQHVAHLEAVFEALRKANLRAAPTKCEFATDRIIFLGHLVTAEGVTADPAKVEAISKLLAPTNVKELRSFLGMTGYYRRLVYQYSYIARSLSNLLHKDVPWEWTPECQNAYLELKRRLMNPPILARPDYNKRFYLNTDYSKYAIAAVLSQRGDDGELHPVAYASRVLKNAELNYPAVEGEILAVVWAVSYFRHYLHSARWTLLSDQLSIKWLLSTKNLSGRLCRWSLILQEYNFDCEYVSGAKNVVADSLSRLRQDGVPYERLEESTGSGSPLPEVNLLTTSSDMAPLAMRSPYEAEDDPLRAYDHDDLPEYDHASMHGLPIDPMSQELWGYDLDLVMPIEEYRYREPLEGPLDEPMEIYFLEGEDEGDDSDGKVPSDLQCHKCGSPGADHLMVLCDGCGRPEHTYCMRPRMRKVPRGDWYCKDCTKDRPFSPNDVRPGLDKGSPRPLLTTAAASQPPSPGPDLLVAGATEAPLEEAHSPSLEKGAEEDAADSSNEGSSGLEDAEAHVVDIMEDKNLLEYLETGSLSADLTVAERRRVRQRARPYEMEDGIVYKRATQKSSKRVVPPKHERAGIIKDLHATYGHFGQKRTSQLVASKYWWWGMVKQVKQYVASCMSCQIASPDFERQNTLRPVRVSTVMERLSVDLVGPLPASFPLQNKYVLTAVEHATRHAFAAPLPSKSSNNVAATLAQLFGIIGPPAIMQTDQGGEFLATAVQSLLRRHHVTHRVSSAYHPQSQGLVERFNKTLVNQLRRHCSGRDPTMWESFLPSILLGYNCGVQDSIRVEPARLFFGRLPRLPTNRDTLPVPPGDNPPDQAGETESDLRAREALQQALIEKALTNLERAQDRQVQEYAAKRAKRAPKQTFQQGEYVMCKVHDAENKLSAQSHGPYVFLRYSGQGSTNTCVLLDSEGREWAENAEHVRPFVAIDSRRSNELTPQVPHADKHPPSSKVKGESQEPSHITVDDTTPETSLTRALDQAPGPSRLHRHKRVRDGDLSSPTPKRHHAARQTLAAISPKLTKDRKPPLSPSDHIVKT